MAFIQRRITIVTVRKPPRANLNDELQWFGSSLGLFGQRDKDKSMFRVFLELVKAAKTGRPLSSDAIAETLDLTRGTVVHHINKLIESGIVLYDGRHYWLRDNSLELLIEEVQKDTERTIEDLRKAAREIDQMLGL
ncbi:helix-turn-helix domain-containing protein [Candidatus Woesearchaeota archaeon]|nr:helix-turn-helix domain-containing protein [Candidatus Woesearchaeota archaeon]